MVDNAHVTQSRLILLDAALILFMSLSLLSYIKFHQYRYRLVCPTTPSNSIIAGSLILHDSVLSTASSPPNGGPT